MKIKKKTKRRKCVKVPQQPYVCDGCKKCGGKCPNRDKYIRDKKWKKEIGEIND